MRVNPGDDRRGSRRRNEPVFGIGLLPAALIAYLLGELWVFSLVSARIGFILAVLLALAKSALGMALVGAFMRKALETARRSGGFVMQMRGGTLGRSLLGALFLVLPGYLSGVIAIVLLLSSLGGGTKQGRRGGVGEDGVLELNEEEWQEVQDSQRRRRVPRRDGG